MVYPPPETRRSDDTSTDAAAPTVKQSQGSKIPRQKENSNNRWGAGSTPKKEKTEPKTGTTRAVDRSTQTLEGKENNPEEVINFLKQEIKIWRQRDNRARLAQDKSFTWCPRLGSYSTPDHHVSSHSDEISERGDTPPKNAWKKAIRSHIKGLLAEEEMAARMMTQAASYLQQKRGKEHKAWIKAIHKTYQKRCRTIRQHEDDLKTGKAETGSYWWACTSESIPAEHLKGKNAHKTPFRQATEKGRQKKRGGGWNTPPNMPTTTRRLILRKI